MKASLIAERYRLDQLLGEVNHSQFYQGYDVIGESRVLIRLIDLDQDEQRFRHKLEGFMANEFRVVAKLVHPNVLQTLNYGLEDRVYYQINEYIPFTTLHQYLLENPVLDLHSTLRFVLQIADTITYFHRIDIIHCDLKPENILVHRDDIKLMEFSIANHIREGDIVTGTPPYMSPESATGAAPAPARDIWALGIVLFEMLARQLPYRVEGRMDDPAAMPELLTKIIKDPVPQIETVVPTLPPRLIALVNWMLEKDLSRRIGSMRQVATEIETIMDDLRQGKQHLSAGEVINGRYRLQSAIAEGGFGQVFVGADLQSGGKIAIKKLKPVPGDQSQHVARFKREAEILGRLDHPGIIKIIDTLELDTGHYMVMQYAEGGDLRALLNNGSVPFKQAITLARDIADALAVVHDLGIVHRDIKPENVLLTADGAARLTDFGISYVADATRLTESKALIGTFQYMAPEVLEGSSPSKQSDIWSFGVLFYELLAGTHPFLRTTVSQIIMAIVNEPIPDISAYCGECPDSIVRLVATLLERNPSQRTNSMREVVSLLEAQA